MTRRQVPTILLALALSIGTAAPAFAGVMTPTHPSSAPAVPFGLRYGGCYSDTPLTHELYGWCWPQSHRVEYETTWVEYTVRHGDTAWSIAKRFTGSGRDWRMITDDWGNAISPSHLRVGEDVFVPHPIRVN